MSSEVSPDHTTKRRVIADMGAGLPWDAARQRANTPASRAVTFRPILALPQRLCFW